MQSLWRDSGGRGFVHDLQLLRGLLELRPSPGSGVRRDSFRGPLASGSMQAACRAPAALDPETRRSRTSQKLAFPKAHDYISLFEHCVFCQLVPHKRLTGRGQRGQWGRSRNSGPAGAQIDEG